MTAGNGYDTEFLLNTFPNAKIYAFDKQLEAIESTKKRVGESVTLIHDGHENILSYVEEADLILFNLGYLPQSNSTVTTTKHTTIKAIKDSLSILNKGGVIIIVVYIGHIEGYEESTEINYLLKSLDNSYDTYEYKLLNKKDAPYINIIQKK